MKSIINIVLFFSGIFIGMFMYKKNWFPLSLYRQNKTMEFNHPYGVFVIPYTKGTPLFSDRIYSDEI